MGLHLLALAIAFEVSATLGLKAAASSDRPWIPAALAVAGYAIAFLCLSRSLVSLPVGLAYALWAGTGTVGVAILGAYFFGESPPPAAWLGVALVVGGVVVVGVSLPPH